MEDKGGMGDMKGIGDVEVREVWKDGWISYEVQKNKEKLTRCP
jgi:hypothetical protein